MKQNMLLLIRDWNIQIGNIEENVVASYDFGNRNEAGDQPVDFCQSNDSFIANTVFKQS